MLKNIFKNYVYPIATLSGSIIGVGFLSLPYVASKVGMVAMFFYFVVLTALMIFIHTIVGQISLKTPDFKRWPGFVGYYLGKFPKKIMMALIVFGICSVMLVYLIIGSQFLSVVLAPMLGGSVIWYALLYFFVASIFIYFGVKGFSHIDLGNINIFPTGGGGIFGANWFLPYGAILFSLWGSGFIPEIEEMVRGNKRS